MSVRWLFWSLAIAGLGCGQPQPPGPTSKDFALTFANGALAMKVGEVAHLQVAPVDGSGQPFTGLFTVAWSSSSPAVTVTTDGTITAANVGSAVVTAVATRSDTGSTATASATVTVTSATTTDTMAPSVPAGVSATATSGTQVVVTWSASTDNVGVAGYRVFRDGTLVGSTAALSFTDSGVSAGRTYQYAVAAFDGANNVSAQSTVVSVTTPGTTPPPDGLVAAYGFDQGSGGSVRDDSGHGLSGTFVGAPAWGAGKNAGGLTFDGTGRYVTMGDVAALDGLTRFTVSAWVKTTAMGEKHLVDKSSCDGATTGGPFEFGTSFFTAGRATLLVYRTTGSPSYVYAESSTSVADGAWHFIAGVYDGAALRVFVDGVASGSTSAPGLTFTSSSHALEVGGHCSGNAYPWVGGVDDVRLYNRALSATELAADQGTAVPPGSSNPGTDAGMPTGDAGTPDAGGPRDAGSTDGGSNRPTYSLDFATAALENPLSAGGVWTNNSQGTGGNQPPGNLTSMAVALASDGRTHIAIDTQQGALDGYDDSFAFVPGFSGDQYIEAVIYKEAGYNVQGPIGNHELELLLGCSSTTGSRTWNELNFNSGGGAQIAFLTGDPSGFTILNPEQFFSAIPVDGDVVRATRVGLVLSLYLNGQLWLRLDGTSNPGMVARGNGLGIAAFIRMGATPNKYGFRRVTMGSL